ncbi:tripartite tricarboxylate transporter substrate-binding protein [Prauserella alba]|uniref:Tripartite-type tricarboxylate transporter, receptor component TctC n=1 Tax=Prauserella alba TaxID=176898 RepID=A0ABN1V4W2_9PSEU|nr:tripartite tricarboxylate transporter substrate-binding protein [Prauserella alba]MCP2183344.1 Tripartite-type tricarboxylate transporter, receptor component TctC [Prauserella alba]
MHRKLAALTTVPILAVGIAGCGSLGGSGSENGLDVNRVRVVLGSSSTTADTYQNSHAFTTHVGEELGVNMKADAIGANRAFQALDSAKTDGSTVMFFHDMAYLSVKYGAQPEKFALDNWKVGPVVSTNPGAAFLAADEAPYDTMAEAAQWLKDNPGENLTFAVEAGGTSELSLDAFYLWVEDEYGAEVAERIKVFATGSDEEKNQALWAGNVDIIYGSIGGNEQYTKDDVEDKVREKFLGITASEPVEGYDIPTFKEQGIEVDGQPFTFNKEFFLLMPKDVEKNFRQTLDSATAKAIETDGYIDELAKNKFIPNYVPIKDSKDYIEKKRKRLESIIDQAPEFSDLAS